VKIEEGEYGKLYTINGNFKKQGTYKIVKLLKRMINNTKSLDTWLVNAMKLYDYDGACPKCESINLTRYDSEVVGYKLNNHVIKKFLVETELVHIRCNECKHLFNKEQLKYVNTMVYYK
jgi:Zn finger protein HypA/HybF involved in hydrogenase expression